MAGQGLGLEQKLQQKLSPLQIQTIKLIELPQAELDARIRQEVEENPVLDPDPDPEKNRDDDTPKDISIEELQQQDDTPSYKYKVSNWGPDQRPEYNTFSVQESFNQSLTEQLLYLDLTQHELDIATFIVGSLDDNGFLTRDLESIVDDLAFRAGITTESGEVERMLKIVQSLEPAGVGARNLQECLLLQLKAHHQDEATVNAERIIENEWDEFRNKHFQKVMTKLHLDEDQLKVAIKRITRLNPAPGGQIDDNYISQTQQVIPDFKLEENNGVLSFSMPRFRVPELRVQKKYAEMLENAKGNGEKKEKETLTFVKQKVDSAKWFVEALRQRENTLKKTMQAIMDYQYEFFLEGDEAKLRPMVLKDIAEKTGFDISTISRVVNSKYIETHFGIYPLKYFFSEGMENSEGEEVSTRELKKALQECVDNEDKHTPLTDEQLVVEMNRRGYKVARRTIAKYRGQLGIPLARWRKEL